jgi:hypothetical protein
MAVLGRFIFSFEPGPCMAAGSLQCLGPQLHYLAFSTYDIFLIGTYVCQGFPQIDLYRFSHCYVTVYIFRLPIAVAVLSACCPEEPGFFLPALHPRGPAVGVHYPCTLLPPSSFALPFNLAALSVSVFNSPQLALVLSSLEKNAVPLAPHKFVWNIFIFPLLFLLYY